MTAHPVPVADPWEGHVWPNEGVRPVTKHNDRASAEVVAAMLRAVGERLKP